MQKELSLITELFSTEIWGKKAQYSLPVVCQVRPDIRGMYGVIIWKRRVVFLAFELEKCLPRCSVLSVNDERTCFDRMWISVSYICLILRWYLCSLLFCCYSLRVVIVGVCIYGACIADVNNKVKLKSKELAFGISSRTTHYIVNSVCLAWRRSYL